MASRRAVPAFEFDYDDRAVWSLRSDVDEARSHGTLSTTISDFEAWLKLFNAVAERGLGRPQSSWTRIKGESDVTRRWGMVRSRQVKGAGSAPTEGARRGDRSRRRRGGDGVGGLGAGTTVEREPEPSTGFLCQTTLIKDVS